jgi:hypothetical protein
MKFKVYMRVAKTKGPQGFKVIATTRPSTAPLTTGNYNDPPLPTIAFAIVLDINPEAFKYAEQVIAELPIEPLDVDALPSAAIESPA